MPVRSSKQSVFRHKYSGLKTSEILTIPILFSLITGFLSSPCYAQKKDNAFLIKNARIFDGTGTTIKGDVLIEGALITAIGPHLKKKSHSKIIYAQGQTLLPGLHDLHTHLSSSANANPEDRGKTYAAYLVHGVTTVNDFSTYGEMFAPLRLLITSGQQIAPHILFASRFSTSHGHGTEAGWGEDFTYEVNAPQTAFFKTKKTLTYHPDMIKVFTDGWRYGHMPDLSDMNGPTLQAITTVSHQAGLPVMTHTVTLRGAKIATAADVDALGHGVGDTLVDEEEIKLLKEHHVAYVPTLSVYEPEDRPRFDENELIALQPVEQQAEQAKIINPPSVRDMDRQRYTIMETNVQRLAKAGIPIAIGTDAGMEGTWHGASTLHEIKLLTKLGFSAAQALKAATANSADIIDKNHRHGRIAVGQIADLILVKGAPDQNINDLDQINQLWLAGREIKLKALRDLLAMSDMTPLPSLKIPEIIYSGKAQNIRYPILTDFGTRPIRRTDAGADRSFLILTRDEETIGRPLLLTAQFADNLNSQGELHHAALEIPLTPGGVLCADVSEFTGIAFTVRGHSTGNYQLKTDHYGSNYPFTISFKAQEQEQEIHIAFSQLTNPNLYRIFNPKTIRTVSFELSGMAGDTEWLELKNIHFYH
ncbi:MAG: amidohydrolase family protein [Zymomonas mobilis subsp. pomaceae]|uniref:amidohydrolase family protein n=1 Tax=Zymomonas mobilis TaxID=542 RepID=UPI0039E90FCB